VVVYYRTGAGFAEEPPLLPAELEDVPEGTRPMIPVHLTLPGHVIRFVACHWTASDVPSSVDARERLADVLRRDTYEFLEPEVPVHGTQRHVLVLGDLNEEPTAKLFDVKLNGRRDRESCRTRHERDDSARRVRLYNAAWRYLGEQVPHRGGVATTTPAGTYCQEPYGWRTLDHVLVSAGLLGELPPYLDESRTGVASTPLMRNDRGRPVVFDPDRDVGVSDHLPILGRLVLPENPP
jgi:endonuclease/exonuclease/phosphatase family metal-dependent hydrolase